MVWWGGGQSDTAERAALLCSSALCPPILTFRIWNVNFMSVKHSSLSFQCHFTSDFPPFPSATPSPLSPPPLALSFEFGSLLCLWLRSLYFFWNVCCCPLKVFLHYLNAVGPIIPYPIYISWSWWWWWWSPRRRGPQSEWLTDWARLKRIRERAKTTKASSFLEKIGATCDSFLWHHVLCLSGNAFICFLIITYYKILHSPISNVSTCLCGKKLCHVPGGFPLLISQEKIYL